MNRASSDPRGIDRRAEGAFELVYAEHHDHLLRLAGSWLHHDGAEHVVQEVLLDHWRRPERHDPGRGSLRTYLRVACRYRAIDLLRSESARRRRDTTYGRSAAEHTDAADVLDRHEVAAALQALPAAQGRAIALAFYGDLTYREVARRLGTPEGTVKTQIRSGLHTLRATFEAARPVAL